MSQKKPTTNQQLEEMRAMIANLEPGKVVTLDRELRQRNTTLMLMLYGAVAKYGIGMASNTGILVTAQVPVLQVPANHSLQWEISEDGKTIMMYIVLNETESAEGRTDEAETLSAPGDGGESAESGAALPEAMGGEETLSSIGDEFEDEIVVGFTDEERGMGSGD